MECYGLDRFSEDIDLDSTDRNTIPDIVDKFCADHGYRYRIGKDTSTVKRYFINYGNEGKPLKVEVSYRPSEIRPELCTNVNGICVYTLDHLAQMKSLAYSDRDKIRDLYDICSMVNSHLDELSIGTQGMLKLGFGRKNVEYIDYLLYTQEDPLIDKDKLADDALTALDMLGELDHERDYEKERELAEKEFCDAVMSIPTDDDKQAQQR